MKLWQKILAAVVCGGLLLVAVVSWGSLGSMICIYALIVMVSAVLFQKFVTNRDSDYFDME